MPAWMVNGLLNQYKLMTAQKREENAELLLLPRLKKFDLNRALRNMRQAVSLLAKKVNPLKQQNEDAITENWKRLSSVGGVIVNKEKK